MNVITIKEYTLWKQVVQDNAFAVFHIVDGSASRISWAGNKDYIFHTTIREDDFADYGTNFEGAATVVTNESEAKTQILNPSDIPQKKEQAGGTQIVAIEGRIGKEVIYASHNFCDPQTWYSESVRVDDNSLTDNAGTWESGDANWISMVGGKVMDEDALSEDQTIFDPEDPHGYLVKVTVDAVEKTERLPLDSEGGEFTVDYANGTVTPISPEDWTGQTVLASYSKAGTSGWLLKPLPGKALVIGKSEVQFAQNLEMNTSIVMQAFGDVTFFAPQLAVSNGGPLPDGTPIPIETTYYKTLDQLVDEAVASFPEIPALSPGTNRGFQNPKIVFQFFYGATKALFASLGMSIRISLASEAPLGGERATATFYANSKTDPGPAKGLAEVLAE